MKIEINLKANPFVKMPVQLYEHEQSVLLHFVSDIYPLNVLGVYLKSGDREKNIVTHGEDVEITDFCRAGQLDIQISLLERGEKVKTWRLEPLILKEAEGGLISIPGLDEMQAQISALSDGLERTQLALAELNSKINETI